MREIPDIEAGTYTMTDNTITMERLRFRARHRIGSAIRMQRREWDEPGWDCLVREVEAELLGHRRDKHTVPVTFEYPANWWQALKLWWRDHLWGHEWRVVPQRPIRMRTATRHVEYDEVATFPESDYAYPDSLGAPVIRMMDPRVVPYWKRP